jgi:nucleotidyltransferase/DNA polymerase involved in DNA repair
MIVHLDADAFFASVEQAADPKLRGRPVAVGGTARGVVTSASYEARKLGIYSTMPTARARKICPRLVVVPGDFEKYERFSRFMFSYAYDFTLTVEVPSIDEGYFDLRAIGNAPLGKSRRSSAHHRPKPENLGFEVSRQQAGQRGGLETEEAILLLEVASGGERDFLRPLETSGSQASAPDGQNAQSGGACPDRPARGGAAGAAIPFCREGGSAIVGIRSRD